MLVSVAIVLMVSAQVLVSFSTLNERTTLDRAAQELAFHIRRAQNMALAVAPVNLGAAGTPTIPQAVGIRISTNDFLFFADQNKNGNYDGASEQIGPLGIFPRNIRVASITGEVVGNPGANIIFYTPEATVALTNFSAVAIPNFIDIRLQGASGAIKIVRVRISGQVTVR